MGEKNTTKKCPECQTEISAKAKKCPQCQSDLRSWPARHPILTTLGILILFPIIMGWMTTDTAIKNDQESTQANNNTINNISTAKQATQTPQTPSLELLSMNCYEEYSFFHITGEVKNITDKSLDNIEAVGSTYTKDGQLVKSDEALIEYNPILPGQTSPYEVLSTSNPEMAKCKVDFKELMGGSIMTKDGRTK